MNKIIVSFLLLLSLLCVMIVIPNAAIAAGNGLFTVSTVSGKAGDVVNVKVTITNNPGIATFSLKLNFDNSKLEPVALTKGAAVTSGSITSNVQAGTNLSQLSFVSAFWVNANNITANGELYTVQFKIKTGASGNIPLTLTYNPNDVANKDYNNVPMSVVNGAVNVVEQPPFVITLSSTLAKQNTVITGDVSVTITNNTASSRTGLVVIAVYDSARQVLLTKMADNLPLTQGENAFDFNGISVLNATANSYSVKVMCWGSTSTIEPIAMPEIFSL